MCSLPLCLMRNSFFLEIVIWNNFGSRENNKSYYVYTFVLDTNRVIHKIWFTAPSAFITFTFLNCKKKFDTFCWVNLIVWTIARKYFTFPSIDNSAQMIQKQYVVIFHRKYKYLFPSETQVLISMKRLGNLRLGNFTEFSSVQEIRFSKYSVKWE